jgi:hypothetical protein
VQSGGSSNGAGVPAQPEPEGQDLSPAR